MNATTASQTGRSTAKPARLLTRNQWLALAEAYDQGGAAGFWISCTRQVDDEPVVRRLVQLGFAEAGGYRQFRVTDAGVQALRDNGLSGSITSIRERLKFPAGHGMTWYRTDWLNTGARAAAAPTRLQPYQVAYLTARRRS